jgi:FkbM family methyltransferase
VSRPGPVRRAALLVLRTLGYRTLWLADRVEGKDLALEAAAAARTERWYADEHAHVRRIDFPLGPGDVAFDVGAYTGEWAAELYARLRCRIEAFEPVEEFAARLDDRFGPNDDIAVHHYGLGGRTRDELLSEEGARSSAVRGFAAERGTRVRIRDVVEALDELAPGGVALLKLNIEGGEYELLERLLEAGRLRDVGHLLVQFHDHVPGAAERRDAIRARLADTHEPMWDFPFVWEAWRPRDSGAGG